MNCDGGGLLGFPHWWQYLRTTTDAAGGCQVVFNPPGDIWLVVLAIIDILLRVGGIVAVIMIIVAGFKYLGAMGNTEKAAAARKSIQNALIGLAITLIAVVLVSFIGNSVGS